MAADSYAAKLKPSAARLCQIGGIGLCCPEPTYRERESPKIVARNCFNVRLRAGSKLFHGSEYVAEKKVEVTGEGRINLSEIFNASRYPNSLHSSNQERMLVRRFDGVRL